MMPSFRGGRWPKRARKADRNAFFSSTSARPGLVGQPLKVRWEPQQAHYADLRPSFFARYHGLEAGRSDRVRLSVLLCPWSENQGPSPPGSRDRLRRRLHGEEDQCMSEFFFFINKS